MGNHLQVGFFFKKKNVALRLWERVIVNRIWMNQDRKLCNMTMKREVSVEVSVQGKKG